MHRTYEQWQHKRQQRGHLPQVSRKTCQKFVIWQNLWFVLFEKLVFPLVPLQKILWCRCCIGLGALIVPLLHMDAGSAIHTVGDCFKCLLTACPPNLLLTFMKGLFSTAQVYYDSKNFLPCKSQQLDWNAIDRSNSELLLLSYYPKYSVAMLTIAGVVVMKRHQRLDEISLDNFSQHFIQEISKVESCFEDNSVKQYMPLTLERLL